MVPAEPWRVCLRFSALLARNFLQNLSLPPRISARFFAPIAIGIYRRQPSCAHSPLRLDSQGFGQGHKRSNCSPRCFSRNSRRRQHIGPPGPNCSPLPPVSGPNGEEFGPCDSVRSNRKTNRRKGLRLRLQFARRGINHHAAQLPGELLRRSREGW